MMDRRTLVLAIALFVPILAGGCTGKAHALKVSAGQFEAESLAAIDGIDKMRDAEFAPLEVAPAEASRRFVDNAITSKKLAVPSRIEFWMNPDEVTIDAAEEKRWDDLMECLREQYATFARIFDSSEQASFTGRETVGKAQPHVENLTAQMAGGGAKVRSRQIQQGIVVTDADVAEMNGLRTEIEQAADTQAIVVAVGRVALFAAKRFV